MTTARDETGSRRGGPIRPGRLRGRFGSDAGVVEFTGLLPIILTTCLLGWEAFLIGMSATYAGHAANEGARVASVGGDAEQVRRAAVLRIAGTWADEENIDVRYPSGRVCDGTQVAQVDRDCGYVRVSIRAPLLIPAVSLPTTVSARTRIVDERAGVE